MKAFVAIQQNEDRYFSTNNNDEVKKVTTRNMWEVKLADFEDRL